MITGNINFIFHSHLPWVLNHGDWPHGEDWLHEAVCESYIPIIKIAQELNSENISTKFTIGFSPILCEQIAHRSFLNRFIKYCEYKIEFARRDELRFIKENQDELKINLSKYWQKFYAESIEFVRSCKDNNILNRFKNLQDKGQIEIITCGATHAYLPLVGSDKTVNLQLKLAVKNYKKHFGRQPRGIWLPECGYRPAYSWRTAIENYKFNDEEYRFGIEELLEENGLEYFVSDQKNLTESINVGDEEGNSYSELTPYKIYNVVSKYPKKGGRAKLFTRAYDLSMKVWSGEKGYPGDPDYLDFHKKEGSSMLRYWQVTDTKLDMAYKKLYQPDSISNKSDIQSHNFVNMLEAKSKEISDSKQIRTSITLPFDTELFGHWWFEGPEFLKNVFKGIHQSRRINLSTCSEQLEFSSGEKINLKESSWGKNNDHSVWMNDQVKWCWEKCYLAEAKILDLIDENKQNSNLTDKQNKILNQLLISLQLLLSSDWEFLIENGSAVDYSEMRVANHFSDIERMLYYYSKISDGKSLNLEEQEDLEATYLRDDPFPELNFKDLFV